MSIFVDGKLLHRKRLHKKLHHLLGRKKEEDRERKEGGKGRDKGRKGGGNEIENEEE